MMSLSITSYGQNLKFTNNTIPDLIFEADSIQKIFVYVTASGEEAYSYMERKVFTDPEIADFYNAYFLNKIIYQDKDSVYKNDPYSTKFKAETKTIPGFYFLDHQGYVLLSEFGIKNADDLLRMGMSANIMHSVSSQVNEKKQNYEANKTDKAFLKELIKQENGIGIKDSVALYDMLYVTSEDDYLDIEIIRAILYNEESIYGDGYKFISEDANRSLAAIVCCEEDNMGMDEIMYNKALEIIQNNLTIALNERNEKLLDDCKEELKRVMTDKEKAERICNKAHKRFYR